MQNQQDLQPLSPSEMNCLKEISEHGDNFSYSGPEQVVLRLLEMRLIEKAPPIWLPLEMKHDCYRTTPLGQQLIAAWEQEGQ